MKNLALLALAVLTIYHSGAAQRIKPTPEDADAPRVVYTLGEVESEKIAVPTEASLFGPVSQLTVLAAVSKAKPKDTADLGHLVVVLRGESDVTIIVVDVRKMILTGNTTMNVLVQEDGVLFFPKASLLQRLFPANGGVEGDAKRNAKRNAEVSDQALEAMLTAFSDDRTHVLVWAHRLNHAPEAKVRQEAAVKLLGFGSQAEQVVPQLARALDQDATVVREVVTLLGALGPAAKSAVPRLRKLKSHPDKQTRARVAVALRQITTPR